MPTLQRIREETCTSTQSVFLDTRVNTEQQSVVFIKKLTAVAVSHVLYLRNVFHEECYNYRKLGQLKLRILSERNSSPSARCLVKWMKGCFDAIEKKYLKQLMLGIFLDESKPDEIIEGYTFRFSYHEDGNVDVRMDGNMRASDADDEGDGEEVTSEYDSPDEYDGEKGEGDGQVNVKLKRTLKLEQSMQSLLRHIIVVTQGLDKLPANAYLTLKLLYYDDVTPEEYQPPGFQVADSHLFTFQGDPISIVTGEVDSHFHRLKMKIKTDRSQFPDFNTTKKQKVTNNWDEHDKDMSEVDDEEDEVRRHMSDLALGRNKKKQGRRKGHDIFNIESPESEDAEESLRNRQVPPTLTIGNETNTPIQQVPQIATPKKHYTAKNFTPLKTNLFPTMRTQVTRSPVLSTLGKGKHTSVKQSEATCSSKSKTIKRGSCEMEVEKTQASPGHLGRKKGAKRVKASSVPVPILIQSRQANRKNV